MPFISIKPSEIIEEIKNLCFEIEHATPLINRLTSNAIKQKDLFLQYQFSDKMFDNDLKTNGNEIINNKAMLLDEHLEKERRYINLYIEEIRPLYHKYFTEKIMTLINSLVNILDLLFKTFYNADKHSILNYVDIKECNLSISLNEYLSENSSDFVNLFTMIVNSFDKCNRPNMIPFIYLHIINGLEYSGFTEIKHQTIRYIILRLFEIERFISTYDIICGPNIPFEKFANTLAIYKRFLEMCLDKQQVVINNNSYIVLQNIDKLAKQKDFVAIDLNQETTVVKEEDLVQSKEMSSFEPQIAASDVNSSTFQTCLVKLENCYVKLKKLHEEEILKYTGRKIEEKKEDYINVWSVSDQYCELQKNGSSSEVHLPNKISPNLSDSNMRLLIFLKNGKERAHDDCTLTNDTTSQSVVNKSNGQVEITSITCPNNKLEDMSLREASIKDKELFYSQEPPRGDVLSCEKKSKNNNKIKSFSTKFKVNKKNIKNKIKLKRRNSKFRHSTMLLQSDLSKHEIWTMLGIEPPLKKNNKIRKSSNLSSKKMQSSLKAKFTLADKFDITDPYFDELVQKTTPILGETLHIALTALLIRDDYIKQAKKLSSIELISEEEEIANTHFDKIIDNAGVKFTYICETVMNYAQSSKNSLFFELYKLSWNQAIKTDSSNKKYSDEALIVTYAMLSKHNFHDQEILGTFHKTIEQKNVLFKHNYLFINYTKKSSEF